MSEISVFSEDQIRAAVRLEREGVELIATAFKHLSGGRAVQPPVMRFDISEQNGELDVKGAYIRGMDSFAVKMSSGFFNNPKLGLPSLGGLMILFCSSTGQVKSVLLDNGYLTDLRTALAGAVAADCLAKTTVSSIGIVGTGAQARYQLRALTLVRDFDVARVWGRSSKGAEKYAAEMSETLGKEVVVAPQLEELFSLSEIVVTTTPATEPLVRAEWLRPGLHITAMGSDAEHKNELDPGILEGADLVACDSRVQCFRLGELHHAKKAKKISENDDRVVELGEIVAGKRSGRSSDHQVSVCDLTGTGVQDTAIANLAYARLVAAAGQ